jgi:LDH2 family malate/lactate/ureidoglycolate dehydrogenase
MPGEMERLAYRKHEAQGIDLPTTLHEQLLAMAGAASGFAS